MADELGAIINLDDFTHIACVEKVLDTFPETMSCRFNPAACSGSPTISWTIREIPSME